MQRPSTSANHQCSRPLRQWSKKNVAYYNSKSQQVIASDVQARRLWSRVILSECSCSMPTPLGGVHWWTNAGQNNTLNKSQLWDAGMYCFVNMQMRQSIQESHRVHYTVLSPAILWSVKSGSLTERALYNTRLHLIMLNRGSLFLRYMYRRKNSVVWKWIRNVTEVEGPGD